MWSGPCAWLSYLGNDCRHHLVRPTILSGGWAVLISIYLPVTPSLPQVPVPETNWKL